ncbi:MAG: DUF932 domain-containing protein [Pirellulaceae bacterium]|nr:DUF932 domain-containing protein [Pirellulaceae bacterium]
MTLIKHCGARAVTWGELDEMRTPPATATWFPLPHSRVLESVVQTLDQAGFQIRSMELAVTPDDARFFGTLQLQAHIAPGVALAVGCRNSVDKSLPIGFCCGQHVFVCDNLAFSSDVVITRRHTRFGQAHFGEAIAATVAGLHEFRQNEARRIELYRTTELARDQANSLILQAYERGIIGARLLPDVIRQWRNPSHPEFQERTAWSLLNAFTEVLKDRQRQQPARAAHETITLQKLLDGTYGIAAQAA